MSFKFQIVKLSSVAILLILLTSCASYNAQYGRDFKNKLGSNKNSSDLIHELILVGNTGGNNGHSETTVLKALERYIPQQTSTQTLLFLGDNIFPLGTRKDGNLHKSLAEEKLNAQINLAQKVKGSTIFLPGNNDWYNGLDGLVEQKKYIENALGKKSIMPKNYEAIEEYELNDQITIIAIDSEWFIQNWDKHANINEQSFIKSREDFFEEFKRLINKNQNKITVVAIHHPLITNGAHGGFFSARQHLYPYKNIPVPLLGSVVNYLRKTSGASPTDTQFTFYRNMIDRIKTITKNQEQVVFVSGHEYNLQYIENDGVKQIVSGSASKVEEARSVQPTSFSSGTLGFASLKIYNDNKVDVVFYNTSENEPAIVFQKTIMTPDVYNQKFKKVTQTTVEASVYPQEATRKSKTYKFLFGDHYRSVYGTKVDVPVADLATLNGGLKPVISSGDNQSLSLRLEDSEGKFYEMRGLRKSSKQFLQSAIFKNTYIKDKLADTYVLDFIDDYYTTSHPYNSFILGSMSDALGLYHTNPTLVYVPKQDALGKYNETFGDELYMIEEHLGKSQSNVTSLGKGQDIISTQNMLINLEKDEKYQVDAQMYLRARIFDFLIGDWDRHSDKWRWVEKENDGTIIYQPIAIEQDQAFAKIDGKLLSLVNRLNPLRHMQNFDEKFAKPRWITKSAFPLDRILLQNTTAADWNKAAEDVVKGITDEVINNAFNSLPTKIKNQYSQDIINILKVRRSKLVDFSHKYYKELFKYGIVSGTNKKDSFIIHTDSKKLEISHIRNKQVGDTLTNRYTYYPSTTKEIWVYSLDDDDEIQVTGNKSKIKLKLVGGRNNDTYIIDSKTKTKIFDYKSKTNTLDVSNNAKVVLKDQYALNQYDYRKAPLNILAILPDAGYNRDNGVMLGLNATYTMKKFNQNPFSQKHQFRLKYNFATSGVFTSYKGSFKDYSNTGFWIVEALATSSNFTRNYFGFDNSIVYNKESFKDNYYRVRTSQLEFKPSYEWRGRNGSSFLFGPTYESTKIEQTNNRLIDEQLLTHLFDTYIRKHFLGARLKYQFENYDNDQEPTVGLGFMTTFGTRFYMEDFRKGHQYLNSKLNFVVPITNNKKLTWSSTYLFEKIFGADYHFYQAASIGSNNGLRGYRQQRFIGNTSFVTSQDLRYKMQHITNGIIPLSYGIYVGYDTGRIWNNFNPDKTWYQSCGGGLWLNTLESFTAHAGLFSSKENILVSFGVGFKF